MENLNWNKKHIEELEINLYRVVDELRNLQKPAPLRENW